MRPTDLEALIPGLREARETEHRNRSLCFAGITWTVAGFEIVAMTPRHKLELQLAGNAFFVRDVFPKAGDLFQILWRLHPKFARSSFALPVLLAKVRLKRKIGQMTHGAVLSAAWAIADYLEAMSQDLPEGGEDGGKSSSQYVHWLATEMSFYLRKFNGFTGASYMDTPYLLLQQLFRAYRVSEETDPKFIDASDAIVGRWQNELAKKASAKS